MDRLEPAQVEAIFHRAAEIEKSAPPEFSGVLLTIEEVVSAGVEAGISSAAMRQAIRDFEASSALVPIASARPASVADQSFAVTRVVSASEEMVGERLDRFMRDELGAKTCDGNPMLWEVPMGRRTAIVRATCAGREGNTEVELHAQLNESPATMPSRPAVAAVVVLMLLMNTAFAAASHIPWIVFFLLLTTPCLVGMFAIAAALHRKSKREALAEPERLRGHLDRFLLSFGGTASERRQD